jgi:hypothetical protein
MEKQSYRDRLVSLDKASVDTVEEFCKKHNMSVVIGGKNTIDNITGFAQLRLSATEDNDERPYLKCVLRACFALMTLRDTVDYKIVQITEEIEKLRKSSPNLTGVKPAEKVFELCVTTSLKRGSSEDLPISVSTISSYINALLPERLENQILQKIKEEFEKQKYTVFCMTVKECFYEYEYDVGPLQKVNRKKVEGFCIEVKVEEPLEKTIKDITKKYQEDKSAQLHTLTARLEQMRRSKK